jgi:transposase-like protein
MVLSLTARGLTSGEISAHLAEVYGAKVSKETISRITDKVIEEMTEWQNRPLDRVYPVMFIDAIHVKVRDGQVANKPFYAAIGVTVNGERDILGIWAGSGGEGAKYWLAVLTEIKNCGVQDTLIVVCDGLKGLPEAINATWEDAQVQTCVIHLLRNTFKYASRQHWDRLAKDLRPVYTAATVEAAEKRFLEFSETWGTKYPAIIKLWTSAWEEFIPFLAWDVEIRRIICTTNAIESLNARYRRAVRARGHFLGRHRRTEVPLPRHPIPRPHRQRQETLGHEVEASIERFRHQLPGPPRPGGGQLIMPTPPTVPDTDLHQSV